MNELMSAIYMATTAAFITGISIGLVCAIFYGASQRGKVEEAAIERGHAEIDTLTREFTWKE